MSIVTEATYENGVLKVRDPLPFGEHARLKLTISPIDEQRPAGQPDDPLKSVIGIGEGPADGAEQHDRYLYGKRNV